MNKPIYGVVQGNLIRLHEPLDVADGQAVEVQLKIVSEQSQSGSGILRSAGAFSNDQEWLDIMEEIYQDRKLDRTSPSDLP